jgi:hypothetical protein
LLRFSIVETRAEAYVLVMFSGRKSTVLPAADIDARLSAIEARQDVIDARISRIERRWAPSDQRGLEAALASLGRAVAKEARGS